MEPTEPTTDAPLYAPRNHMGLEPHFSAHMLGMMREGLHAKSAIAGELAYRDAELATLRARLETAERDLRKAQVEIARRTSFMEKEREKYNVFPAIYAPKLGPLQCFEGSVFGEGPIDVPLSVPSRLETLEGAMRRLTETFRDRTLSPAQTLDKMCEIVISASALTSEARQPAPGGGDDGETGEGGGESA